MDDAKPPVTVAIIAFPETSASVVYGLHDLLSSAGRDWGVMVDGRPGPSLIKPTVVSKHDRAFTASNDVTLTPERGLEDVTPDIVCVPEVNLAPGEGQVAAPDSSQSPRMGARRVPTSTVAHPAQS